MRDLWRWLVARVAGSVPSVAPRPRSRASAPPGAPGPLRASTPSTLRVTEVRFQRTQGDGLLKARVTIVLNGTLTVTGLKLIEGSAGLFVSMPARRRKDGTFEDNVLPKTLAVREAIERAVLSAYLGYEDDPGPAGVGARLRPPPVDLGGWIAQNPRVA